MSPAIKASFIIDFGNKLFSGSKTADSGRRPQCIDGIQAVYNLLELENPQRNPDPWKQ